MDCSPLSEVTAVCENDVPSHPNNEQLDNFTKSDQMLLHKDDDYKLRKGTHSTCEREIILYW
jgi:hypothetical protein